MIIDIFQDTVCPWCRIGKKHLFDALGEWSGEPVTIRYRTFFLDPAIPKEGYPFRPFMEMTKGGPEVVEQMLRHVTAAGASAGLTFRFDRVQSMPNTRASHTLIKLAPPDRVSDVVDAVYQAYFEDGRDIGDIEVLAEIAEARGLSAQALREAVEADAKAQEIEEDLRLARELEIRGVPFFVIDGKLALSGAHPKESFLRAFRHVK